MEVTQPKKQRDEKLDILRGFATIIVVIGHVMQKFDGVNDSLLFNIIFSIQMPLFMMISGYARNYSKPVSNIKTFAVHIKKRILSVLVPWAAWSLVACVLLWKMSLPAYIKRATFQMEIAFWFLFSLFTIDVLFSVGELISKSITKRTLLQIILQIAVCAAGTAMLLIVGKIVGITFLGIKYSCYYMLYYIGGYLLFLLFHIQGRQWLKTLEQILTLPCACIYGYLITRYNVFSMPDSMRNIIIRLVISTLGCLVAFLIVKQANVNINNPAVAEITKIGSYSLEIYVVHYFAVRLLDCDSYNLNSVEGMFFAAFYSVFVIGLTVGVIWLLKQSDIINTVMFGKRQRK